MRLRQVIGCVSNENGRLTSLILSLIDPYETDRDKKVLHLPQIGTGAGSECDYALLPNYYSFFEILRVGWDSQGIASFYLKTSEGLEYEFGDVHASIWQKQFSPGRQAVGMFGTEDSSGVIKSIGFITFEEEKCAEAIREREEQLMEAEMAENTGTEEEGDVVETEDTEGQDDELVLDADDSEKEDEVVEDQTEDTDGEVIETEGKDTLQEQENS